MFLGLYAADAGRAPVAVAKAARMMVMSSVLARAAAGLLLLLALLPPSHACNSDNQCDFPFNNVFTSRPFWDTHTARTDFP
jgi:hypothetical protein